MITFISDIMTTQVFTIDAYDGLRKAERIMDEKDTDCLPVMKDGSLFGILTSKDMQKAHPNRIVADAMTKNFVSITSNKSIWEAKSVMERNKTNRLLVVDNGKLVGMVGDVRLYLELGKHTDILTGLYRSDYIYQMGIEFLEKGREISVIFIDLDKFGQIDKDYGHAQGDAILRETATILKSHIYGDTYLCRYGGDEFAVLTPYKLEQCKILAEILLKAVSTHKYPNKIRITASAGIAGGQREVVRADSSYETVANLINLASLASTKAKREKVRLIVADGFSSADIVCSNA